MKFDSSFRDCLILIQSERSVSLLFFIYIVIILHEITAKNAQQEAFRLSNHPWNNKRIKFWEILPNIFRGNCYGGVHLRCIITVEIIITVVTVKVGLILEGVSCRQSWGTVTLSPTSYVVLSQGVNRMVMSAQNPHTISHNDNFF